MQSNLTLTVICNGEVLLETPLSAPDGTSLSFGSLPDNDIVIKDPCNTVSRHHGSFSFTDGTCFIVNEQSTNGLFVNGIHHDLLQIEPGESVTIGAPNPNRECVILLFGNDEMQWSFFDLSRHHEATIGRHAGNDLILPVTTVSSKHALMRYMQDGTWQIIDNNSFNGTFVDRSAAREWQTVAPGSTIHAANVALIYSGNKLFYTSERVGVDIVATRLVKRRKVHRQTRVTNDNISLHIKRGQFVAIVGGSGSGKTTLLDALCGNEPADEGSVNVDGIDLYSNYQQLKNTIGYVPQQDIVYDSLTLDDMLSYSAKLRMPPDTTAQERIKRIDDVIELLELQGVRKNLISNMSGGQKKRASIAVELLADPRLLFLDEPTSGLDPGIEQNLMKKLAAMAHEGRTIVLVTHTTLNLHICDQVIFLGVGGKLCFAGAPNHALKFFETNDYVDIYSEIGTPSSADSWRYRFERNRPQIDSPIVTSANVVRDTPRFGKQFATLVARYAKLLINDRTRLFLLLFQAPLLSALICLVAGEGCFTEYEGTKSCLFALSCAAFWVGILNSIQEICKERDIFKREYASGMGVIAYVLSKVLILGLLCCIQALLLTGVFCAFENPPSTSLLYSPAELLITSFLIMFSAMCLGLFVSALFKNPDRAIAMAPLLIMPQILFSGLVFKLEGVAETVSLFVHCRWGMEAYGTTANLNALDLGIYGEEITVPESETTIDEVVTNISSFDTEINGMTVTVPEQNDMTIEDVQVSVPEDVTTIDKEMYPHDFESMFEYSIMHLISSWEILVAFCAVCVVGCCIAVRIKARG